MCFCDLFLFELLYFVCLKDFHLSGSFVMSCSIDHSLKMWNLNNPKIKNAIDESEVFGCNQTEPK
jgi:hypothetical protein